MPLISPVYQPIPEFTMPIYEYTCSACGAESEILQKLADPPARKCPVCGKSKLSKQISAAGFRLSGGGWYETDFKKDGQKNIAGDKPAPVAATASSDSKKPDAGSKPDSTAKPAKAEKKADSKSDSKSDGKSGKKKAAAAA